MNPFSAGYYIKENRWRAALIITMFALTFTVYLAGLYMSNVRAMFDYSLERRRHTVLLRADWTDENGEDFADVVEELEGESGITLLRQGAGNGVLTQTIMSFHSDYFQYTFQNAKDFRSYRDFVGIKLRARNKEKRLGAGSMVMSRLQARNRGLDVGDTLVLEDGEFADREYTLDALTDEEGYSVYYISDTEIPCVMLWPASMSDGEFQELIDGLKADGKVLVDDYATEKNTLDYQLKNMQFIYFFIIILLSFVMAITINAAFVGMYQYRQGEFALYRAIGISGVRLRLKIVSEVLLMDILGMASGACVLFLGLYLFNHLFLIEHGFRLFYYNKMSMIGLVISNLVVFVPVAVSQSAKLMRADICEY